MFDVDDGKARNQRLRILLVSPSSPWPPDSGGAQRTALLLEALSHVASVDLCLLGWASATQLGPLGEHCGVVHLPELSISWPRRLILTGLESIAPGLALALPNSRRVRQLASLIDERKYDVVVLRYSATACQLKGLPRLAQGTLWIVDVDDFLAQMLTSGEGGVGRNRLRSIFMSLARLVAPQMERRVLLEADGLWVTGWRPSWLPRDKGNVADLPNISWHRSKENPADAANDAAADLLGVAQFSYAPNQEGFDWFIREIWPLIRHSRPLARLKLVGNPPRTTDLNRWRAAPGVELTGKVRDVTAEYGSALVAIAPILRGGGTKIKVLEALEMGVPCVCTTHAAGGLSGLDSLLVTDDPRTFADHCLRLLGDAEWRQQLARSGQREVRQTYNRLMFGDRVSAVVRHVVEQRGRAHNSSRT